MRSTVKEMYKPFPLFSQTSPLHFPKTHNAYSLYVSETILFTLFLKLFIETHE